LVTILKNTYNRVKTILKRIKNYLNLQIILIFILVALFFSLSWTYFSFIKASNLTFENIQSSEIENIKTLSAIIEKNIRYYLVHHGILKSWDFPLGKIIRALSKNPKIRKELNNILSLYVTRTIKYVYVVYKDNNNRLRYLLDGSLPLSERGMFGQVFIPSNTKLWESCFKRKVDIYAVQSKKDVFGLWITYLHPILYKDKVQAILALDVSSGTYNELEDTLIPAKHYLKYMIIFISIDLSTSQRTENEENRPSDESVQ